jgi:Transcriptional regulators
MVTIKEIAKKAKKTEAAVSMALNDKPGVSDETRRQIKQLAEEMGYMPNIIARELSTQVSRTIGLVIPELENPFFAGFATRVNDYLQENDYRMMVTLSSQSMKTEHTKISDLISRRVDGIIVIPVTDELGSVTYSDLLEKSGIPYVFATSYYPAWKAPCVMCDLTMGERIGYDYLLKLGHRRILFIGTNPQSPSNSRRIKGAFEACEKFKLEPEKTVTIKSVEYPDFSRAYAFTRELLRTGHDFTAITTINDIMALGVLKALHEAGVSVPGDISVIGYDNLIFSEISQIPLTTIEQDISKMAVKAVDALLGRLTVEDEYQIKPRLILRSSVSPAIKNPAER